MAACRLTPKAAEDLAGIHEYTIANFGLEQTRDYLKGLRRRFDDLAEHPTGGRRADRLVPGLRRDPHRPHVLMPENEGVLIVRVLHESRDAPRHFTPLS